jgi:hypothetical protein
VNTTRQYPTRFCVVVPLEDGTYEPYCIACRWLGKPKKTYRLAESAARRHTCPPSKEVPTP